MPKKETRAKGKASASPKASAPKKNAKTEQLAAYTTAADESFMTSNQGVGIRDDQNTLKAGSRGPSLLEDHLMREKITHFDHERIPERVVHARGSGAHGIFQVYAGADKYCKADFLKPGTQTPVFVRFSTVAGFRGSSDVARDVRGFATKFYTQQGIFDLVGNNMPVFFIQDGIKFPDLIHAVKPEPHNEIPQAQSAHDTFWDFVSLSTEATHMVMWAMSDRAIPRSLRMMEGFGVHTFRMIDKKENSRFVKFHWRPTIGTHSLLWDEALKISGKDPDFHRRDLWEAIENGAYPEWELSVQLIEEKDEFSFDFDLLDPTKLVPEELVPLTPIGKMTLNRNPDNFFAETEQVAFCISHVVPGIDFTNDPLLQARLFSYPDTQLSRLGSPNFHELPINKSLAPVVNNQRDGHMRHTINPGPAAYNPNTTGGGCPFQAGMMQGGFASFAEKLEGIKVRDRSKSFFDHFSQASLFYNSQTPVEKEHIARAIQFELSHCETPAIRERVVGILEHVNKDLAKTVADGLGIKRPVKMDGPLNQQVPADVDAKTKQPTANKGKEAVSPALSIIGNLIETCATRKIAVIVADGFDGATVNPVIKKLKDAGAMVKIIAPIGGAVADANGKTMPVDFTLSGIGSVLFDAVYVGGGKKSVASLQKLAPATLFVNESYKHCKAIAGAAEGADFVKSCLTKAGLNMSADEKNICSQKNGIVLAGSDEKSVSALSTGFMKAIGMHRTWDRIGADEVAV
jgi:catalase